ncbi:unnamed protein product [Trichogramma brassicae]|uniref:Uncharacterized protein n=1 Tax=Trichogramma brassicae TaxID=86971 RepID=A0A6H5I4R5_9HYME|nr:unnamed protein product [Trichogramma brassicae]
MVITVESIHPESLRAGTKSLWAEFDIAAQNHVLLKEYFKNDEPDQYIQDRLYEEISIDYKLGKHSLERILDKQKLFYASSSVNTCSEPLYAMLRKITRTTRRPTLHAVVRAAESQLSIGVRATLRLFVYAIQGSTGKEKELERPARGRGGGGRITRTRKGWHYSTQEVISSKRSKWKKRRRVNCATARQSNQFCHGQVRCLYLIIGSARRGAVYTCSVRKPILSSYSRYSRVARRLGYILYAAVASGFHLHIHAKAENAAMGLGVSMRVAEETHLRARQSRKCIVSTKSSKSKHQRCMNETATAAAAAARVSEVREKLQVVQRAQALQSRTMPKSLWSLTSSSSSSSNTPEPRCYRRTRGSRLCVPSTLTRVNKRHCAARRRRRHSHDAARSRPCKHITRPKRPMSGIVFCTCLVVCMPRGKDPTIYTRRQCSNSHSRRASPSAPDQGATQQQQQQLRLYVVSSYRSANRWTPNVIVLPKLCVGRTNPRDRSKLQLHSYIGSLGDTFV